MYYETTKDRALEGLKTLTRIEEDGEDKETDTDTNQNKYIKSTLTLTLTLK